MMRKAANQRSAASGQVRLREVLKHFTRLAFVWAACVSLIVPHRQYRLGPFELQWSVPRIVVLGVLAFVFLSFLLRCEANLLKGDRPLTDCLSLIVL